MPDRRKVILCIEDDADTAALMYEELADRGFEVLMATDGREGLALMRARTPDLVLCDVGLPVMSGFEMLEKITSLGAELQNTPFVFITALRDQGSELKGWQLGADDYLTKPVDYDVLAALIKARLARIGRRAVWQNRVDLGEREVEALTWAARGKTFAEIGQILGLSRRTVEFHLEKARAKLGVATRTQALIMAVSGQLIHP